jgi:hypothetical protein
MNGNRKVAKLLIRLKGFELPDTSSPVEGYLDPGSYVVDEFRENFPNEETDYALLQAPELGAEDTWICSRWKDRRYAEITDAPTPSIVPDEFENDPFAITEEVLVGLLPRFEEFRYDRDDARYPYQLPGLRLPEAPPNFNNCCTFAEALLVGAWADAYDTFVWNRERHGQMMIFSNDDYFSPVTAAVDSQMGMAVEDHDSPPHPWTLIQGWRRQWRGGHTLIIVEHHEPTDRVLTLESNSAYRLDGVGFRAIGNLRDHGGRPPDSWWERGDLWTWERIRSTYRYRQQARLRVKERSWSSAT